MAKAKSNPRIGSSIGDYVRRRKKADPEFAKLYDEHFDKLQLARSIRAVREARGLSQEDLARAVGTKQSAIASLEAGKFAPRLDVLHRIAGALGRRLDVRLVREQGRA